MLEIKDIKFDEETGRISLMKGRFVPRHRQSMVA
jgi:hypothetical protein